MPKIKHGNRFLWFPYDPKGIASLLKRGIDVYPDDNLLPNERARQKIEIMRELQTQWTEEPFQTVPKRFDRQFNENFFPEAGFVGKPPETKQDWMGVEANPLLDYTIQQYGNTPPSMMTDTDQVNPVPPKKKGGLLEVLQALFRGSGGDLG